MDVVAIIPARGGSKRIPNKNLVQLAGRPLVAWTIEAAQKATLVDAVFVSTEDARIGHSARHWGAAVIDRPAALAADTSGTEPVLLHALQWLQDRQMAPRYVVLLQCTSPLRPASVIDRGVEMIRASGCDSVVGVHPSIEYFFTGRIESERFVVDYDPLRRPRTQEIAPGYKENGSTYVVSREFLLRSQCRMGGDMRPLIMSETEGLDIDNFSELALARYHLEQRSLSKHDPGAVCHS